MDIARPKGGRRGRWGCFFCTASFARREGREGWEGRHRYARQGRWASCRCSLLPCSCCFGLVRWGEHERAELEEEEESRREHRMPTMGVLLRLQESREWDKREEGRKLRMADY